MIEDLKYFVGKYCTITTVQINYRFKYEEMINYFMGRVESVGEVGLMIVHHVTKCKSFIFLNQIVSISEEQYTEDPEIIKEYKKQKPITADMTTVPTKTPYVDPVDMALIAKRAREAFK